VVLTATTFVVVLGTVLVVALDYLLLIFLGLLLSVFLTKTSTLLSRYIPIGYSWNLALITSLLIFSAIGSIVLFGSKVHEQLQSTSQKLDEGTDELIKHIKGYPMAMNALETMPFVRELLQSEPLKSKNSESEKSSQASSNDQASSSDKEQEGTDEKNKGQPSSKASGSSGQTIQSVAGKVFTVLKQILSTTLGLVANVGVILFVGIFIAVDPNLYRDGFARLFPLNRRSRKKTCWTK